MEATRTTATDQPTSTVETRPAGTFEDADSQFGAVVGILWAAAIIVIAAPIPPLVALGAPVAACALGTLRWRRLLTRVASMTSAAVVATLAASVVEVVLRSA